MTPAPTTCTRTNISSANQITFCNSPINLKIQNVAKDTTIESVIVYLWIWSGNQNSVLGNPSLTLFKEKVSAEDNYINFNIADYIKSKLVGHKNLPYFAWNELSNPSIMGQGVYWQIITDIKSSGVEVRKEYETNFATLGYLWNYEQNAVGSNGVTPNGSLGFNQSVIANTLKGCYTNFAQKFNLETTVATSTSENMIILENITPLNQKCVIDPYILVFLNKLGLWEIFTPVGKRIASSTIEALTSERGFRDPSTIDNRYSHSKVRDGLNVLQSYTFNTGKIDQSNVQCVEELIYSPKLYLIVFEGDKVTSAQVGITVDNTIITVDSTIVTVDSAPIDSGEVGFYKTFQQIPVIITENNFTRKTRINDKTNIEYTIKIEETNNKINNIR